MMPDNPETQISQGPQESTGAGLPLSPPLAPAGEQAAAPANNNIQGMLLYMLGYYYLLAGNKTLALKVLGALESLDQNLARLLQSKINASR